VTGSKGGKAMKEKMFKKVLFPTDFSAVSRKALEYVKELKELGTEEIVLLNVIKNQYYYLSEDSFLKDLEGPVEELKKEAKGKLITIASELQERGFKVKAVIAAGVPFSKILEVAQKEKVSSIILGSQGKGFLKKILFGSVSEAVVRGSKYPVFVIKDDCLLIEGQKEWPETEDRVPWRIFNRIKLNSQARV
jgi:nucleotide-binding universal stress UspA family protein